jgi:LysR family nitrogen assimilation transcriptional regulator
MDIKQLRYFVGVATAGSLTQAAEKLHVAQPALSQQILKLERALGQPLMLRHARGISLTEAGSRLLAHARFILEHLEQAERDIAGLSGRPSGTVRVGMPRGASDLFGIEMLVRARQHYPDLKIVVLDRNSEELSGLLAENQLDLSLSFALPDQSWAESEALYTENLCFAVPPRLQRRNLGGRVVRFAQIAKSPLALPTVGHVLRTLVDGVAAQKSITLDIRFEIDSVQLIRDAVARNLACTILPFCSLIEPIKSARVRVYAITDPTIARMLYLVRSRRRPPSKAVLATRDLIVASIRDRIAAPRFCEVYEPAPALRNRPD